MAYTYTQAAQSALDVQNASNASGVINSLLDVTMAIRAEADRRNVGTRWVNRHPVIALYLFKLGELNGFGICSLDAGYGPAERLCRAIVAGEAEPNYATYYYAEGTTYA